MAEPLEKTFLIGPFVKEKREELGMTQRHLGLKVGLQYGNFIGMLERGETKFPMDSWRQYAEILQVDPAEFCLLCLKELYPDVYEIIPEMSKILDKSKKSKKPEENGGDNSSPKKIKVK